MLPMKFYMNRARVFWDNGERVYVDLCGGEGVC